MWKDPLTDQQIIAIKRSGLAGASAVTVASAFNVTSETIRKIWRGETYSHVKVQGEEMLPCRRKRDYSKVVTVEQLEREKERDREANADESYKRLQEILLKGNGE